MIQGWENGKWYQDYETCRWLPGTMREEHNRRAKEIAQQSNKIIVLFSCGIDSQACYLAFKEQGIDVKTAFLHLPGHNDDEFNRIPLIKEKFNIDPIIITIDPADVKEEILDFTKTHNVHPTAAMLCKFISQLPDDHDIVTMEHDPYVHMTEKNRYWYTGYNSVECLLWRSIEALNRKSKVHFFATSELLYSILADDVYQGVLNSWPYMKNNGLVSKSERDSVISLVDVNTVDRWDYYIKPIIYGRYWGRDELIYFPKSAICDNVDYLLPMINYREHALVIKLDEFLDFLISGPGKVRRFYENVDPNSTN